MEAVVNPSTVWAKFPVLVEYASSRMLPTLYSDSRALGTTLEFLDPSDLEDAEDPVITDSLGRRVIAHIEKLEVVRLVCPPEDASTWTWHAGVGAIVHAIEKSGSCYLRSISGHYALFRRTSEFRQRRSRSRATRGLDAFPVRWDKAESLNIWGEIPPLLADADTADLWDLLTALR